MVRNRPDRAPVRARDGPRARSQAPGPARDGASLHSLLRRLHHDEADAPRRLERGEGRDRGPPRRLGRRARALDRRRGGRFELAEGDRVPRVSDQSLQSPAGRPARWRTDRGCTPSGALVRGLSRAARARRRPPEPAPDLDPDLFRHGALESLADSQSPRAAVLLPGQALAARDDGGALLRARDPARGRDARDARPARPVQRI